MAKKTENLEKFCTSDLEERYGLEKAEVTDRLNRLFILPTQHSKKNFITAEQLQLMNDLNDFLRSKKGNIDDFVTDCIASGRVVPSQSSQTAESKAETDAQTEVEATADASGALITQEQAQALTEFQSPAISLDSQAIEILSSGVGLQISKQELESIDRQAQYNAANRCIALQDQIMVYLSGELKIDNPIDLHVSRDSRQFTTIRKSGDTVTLDDAPLKTVKRKLGDQFATGDLSIRSIFLAGQ